MIPFDVDQAGWGSSRTYADGTLGGGYDPHYVIIHWGGLTSERDTDDLAFVTLRGWQSYHLSKGWQDIAYNYAVTEKGTICRLRGENHGGHSSGVDQATGEAWSTVGIGVVWVGGQSDTDGPSDAAFASMRRIVDSVGLPVIGHRDTGKATACPGGDWLRWAHNYTEDEMLRLGDNSIDVTKAQNYLNRWVDEYNLVAMPLAEDGVYGNATADRVERFQTWADLVVDGFRLNGIDVATLAALVVKQGVHE